MLYAKRVSSGTASARRTLRSLELEAYASVISAFRAQGQLTRDKKSSLETLCKCLGISAERHRAEVRRAVNDELLSSVACSISGEETDKAWRREGQKLSSTTPRLVTHRTFPHSPQVLAASIGAAAVTLAQPSAAAGGGSSAGGRKMPSSIQSALQKIMAQHPSKTQQQPVPAGHTPSPTPGSSPVKAAQRVGTSTAATSTSAPPPRGLSDSKGVATSAVGGANVPEDASGRKEGKGKGYSQLASLLCEESVEGKAVPASEKGDKEATEGRQTVPPPPLLPAPREATPPQVGPRGAGDDTELSQPKSAAGTLAVGEEGKREETRKRPLSDDKEVGVAAKRPALRSPTKRPSPLRPSTTPPKLPAPPKQLESPPKQPQSPAKQTQSPPKHPQSPHPKQQKSPPKQLVDQSSTNVPATSQATPLTPGSSVQVQGALATPATPTLPPIPDAAATELIEDLVSDTSDSTVLSLADQLGVAPSLLNLSDFMSIIQPSTEVVTPCASEPMTPAPPPLLNPVPGDQPVPSSMAPPPPLTLEPSSSQPLTPTPSSSSGPPPLHDMSAVLPPPLTPAHDLPFLMTPDLIPSPVLIRPNSLGLSEQQLLSPVLLTVPPTEATPPQTIPVTDHDSTVATPTVQDIPIATPTVQDIPIATPTVQDIPIATPTVQDVPITTPTVQDVPVATPTATPSTPAEGVVPLDLDIGSLMGNANDSELLEGIPEDMAKSIKTLLQFEQAWNN